MKIVTIYDGTIQSKTALQYGLKKVKEKGGELVVVQTFQHTLFLDYDAGPRAEEIARAEAARHRRDADAIISAAAVHSISVRVRSEEGEPGEEALRVADEEQADLILSTARYRSIIKKASCPVYIIPGTILVPVDSSDAAWADIDGIAAEAKATGSRVLIAGIIPIHVYSSTEQQELEQVRKKTASRVKKIAKALHEKGVDTLHVTREGYPDEEIIKAAEEHAVSLIMLPSGGTTPSELTKAAAILMDEPQRVKKPIYLLPASS